MTQPFRKVENALTTHLVVLVPSTSGGRKVDIEHRVDETQRYLTKLFGGTTKVNAQGTYTGRNGRVVKERISEVEIYTSPEQWEQKKNALLGWLRSKKKGWKQEELAIKYEEDMFWV